MVEIAEQCGRNTEKRSEQLMVWSHFLWTVRGQTAASERLRAQKGEEPGQRRTTASRPGPSVLLVHSVAAVTRCLQRSHSRKHEAILRSTTWATSIERLPGGEGICRVQAWQQVSIWVSITLGNHGRSPYSSEKAKGNTSRKR